MQPFLAMIIPVNTGGGGGGPVDPGYSPPWAQVPGGVGVVAHPRLQVARWSTGGGGFPGQGSGGSSTARRGHGRSRPLQVGPVVCLAVADFLVRADR